jgi:hypothetical protein
MMADNQFHCHHKHHLLILYPYQISQTHTILVQIARDIFDLIYPSRENTPRTLNMTTAQPVAPQTELVTPAYKPQEISFPLPKALHTTAHVHLTILETCVTVFLATTTPGEPGGSLKPMGSFIYAMPDVSLPSFRYQSISCRHLFQTMICILSCSNKSMTYDSAIHPVRLYQLCYTPPPRRRNIRPESPRSWPDG